MKLQFLLTCGILAALVYVTSDALAAWSWDGYSYRGQTISETFAIGAPTRPFVLLRGLAYSTLLFLFGAGVWKSAEGRYPLRRAAGLLMGISLVDLVAPFVAPMHLRGEERTLTDAMHIALASIDVLFILLIVGFGAMAFGRRFRLFSIGTIAVVVVFGTLAGLDGSRLAANLPTPWVGITERISVFGFMLWLSVFAGGLLRGPGRAGSPFRITP